VQPVWERVFIYFNVQLNLFDQIIWEFLMQHKKQN